MSPFLKKPLAVPQRVCFRLKEAREANGISLETLSTRTKISKKHLQAIEECRFHDIPYAAVYQKNFVKRYAEGIDTPAEPLLAQFLLEETNPSLRTIQSPAAKRLRPSWHSFLPSIMRFLGVGSLVVLVVGYLGWQVKTTITPPTLALYSPQDGLISTRSSIVVFGKTEQETRVSINGQEIATDGSGEFKEPVQLSTGVNTITITAKKKHGKMTEETRHVILREATKFSFR